LAREPAGCLSLFPARVRGKFYQRSDLVSRIRACSMHGDKVVTAVQMLCVGTVNALTLPKRRGERSSWSQTKVLWNALEVYMLICNTVKMW
jgi:hypothetical protein